MNSPHSAPAHSARDARVHPDTEDGEESLAAHAKRSLRETVMHKAVAQLDAAIGVLQGLRKRVGGADDEDAGARPHSRDDRAHGHGAVVEQAVAGTVAAPKPARRLRAFLLYLSVLLAGSMCGGALSYSLLAKQIERLSADMLGVQVTAAKNARIAATSQKKVDDALAERDATQKKIEESRAEYAKFVAETQIKLDEAELRLAPLLAAEAAAKALQQSARAVTHDGARPALKTGYCSVAGGNAAALKDCLEKFNR